MAETEDQANKAFDHFIESCEDKFPRAVETLKKDRDHLMAFYVDHSFVYGQGYVLYNSRL
ncbi:MAG: hypothetical protein DRJ47_09000 [Thermoprotei archaeon]|nr:MAG: hypothetical protein DRJ47_09000 [Thermoprotei archaeon]